MRAWQTHGSIIAYPYGWQTPAKTEQWVYETLLARGLKTPYVEYIAFPWATLIDLLKRGFSEQAEPYLHALQTLPVKKSPVRVTACQHIDPECVAEFLMQIKITDLFWAHKTKQEDLLRSMRLHPLALYPVAFENRGDVEPLPFQARRYLYSFIGAYDPGCYISDIREKIFRTEHRSDVYIKRRNYWHFEHAVYGGQGFNAKDLEEREKKEKEDLSEYVDVLSQTQYSLCPSGSGPNSIRFWESFVFGSIPLLMSDDLEVPDTGLYYISWKDDEIKTIHQRLRDLRSDQYVNNDISKNYSDIFLGNVITFMKEWS